MQNYTLYVNIFVAITSYNKILLPSNICNFTSQCPLAAETQQFEIPSNFPNSDPQSAYYTVVLMKMLCLFLQVTSLSVGFALHTSQYIRAH
jgi:hypothetical protein